MKIHSPSPHKQVPSKCNDYFFNYFTLGVVSCDVLEKHSISFGGWAVYLGTAVTMPSSWLCAQFCLAVALVPQNRPSLPLRLLSSLAGLDFFSEENM